MFLTLMLIKTESTSLQCSFNKSSWCYQEKSSLVLYNFERLDQVQFECDQLFDILLLNIIPTSPLIFNNSLDLHCLSLQIKNDFLIKLWNFKGFELESNPFEAINYQNSKKLSPDVLIIFSSNFEFYHKKVLLDSFCNLNSFSYDEQFTSLFKSNLEVLFEEGIIYSTNACPLVFFKASIKYLAFQKFSDTFLGKNVLKFQSMKDLKKRKLHSNIYQCKMSFYRTDLNEKLLNKDAFERLVILDLEGQITFIQDETFKNLKDLRVIRFRMQNIRNVFVRKNTWLEYLNADLDIDPSDSRSVNMHHEKIILLVFNQLFYNLTFYDYPNEDFCYFKRFPHNKLVWPTLKPNLKTQCSCTEVFLIQYAFYHFSSIVYDLNSMNQQYYMSVFYKENHKFLPRDSIQYREYSHCLNESFKLILLSCNFEKRLLDCDLKNVQKDNQTEPSYFYMTDWLALSNELVHVFYIYGNIGFSLLVILFCALMTAVLNYSKPPKETKKMYKFLLINTVFNIIHISISILKSLNFCINEYKSCLLFFQYKSMYNLYFNVLIKFFAKTFQSASNLTHIAFIFSRYFIIAKSTSNMLEKVSLKIYIFITVLISLGLNLHIFFQNSINKISSSIDLVDDFTSLENAFSDSFINSLTPSEYIVLNFFQYIDLIFCDLFYILICIVIDIVLIIFLKKKMRKTNLGNTIVQNVSAVANLNSNLAKNLRNVERNRTKRKESAEKRLTWMVVLNSINFILLRLPLAFLSLYGFFFYYDSQTKEHKPNVSFYIVCRYFKFCQSLQDLLHAFYLTSFIFQFLIFMKYDKNFNGGLKNLRLNLKKKLNCKNPNL